MPPPELPDICGPLGLGDPAFPVLSKVTFTRRAGKNNSSQKEGVSPGEKYQMSGVVLPLG